MPAKARHRSFVDRYLLSPRPPTLARDATLPTSIRPHVALRERLQQLVDTAFPPLNAPPTDPPSVASFQRAVHALDGPLNILVSPLEHGEAVDPQYARLSAEAQVPAALVDMLARILRYRAVPSADSSSLASPHAPFKSYISVMRHPAAIQIVDTAVVGLLRAMNALTAASELLASRLAADRRLLPLLFDSMRCTDAVELALALVEELLHAPRRAPDFDLSTVRALPVLIESLTPFQLGSFCRVLAPLVDERDLPLCGGDHCSGACALSSAAPSHDWQQIESSANQLRARRSYVGAAERVVRDRNHAVVLAIPGLLERLVKLIAVPPAPREELALVDHALRSGVFTLNFDFADILADSPQPVTLQAALVASIRGEAGPGGEIVFQQLGPAGPQGPGRTEAGHGALPPEDEVRQRVLFMVFRRLTGMDNEDADQAGTDSWEVLDTRVSRAAADHGSGVTQNSVFRERRRRISSQGLGVGVRMSAGDTHGVVEVATLGNFQTHVAEGAPGNGAAVVNEDMDLAAANGTAATAVPPATHGQGVRSTNHDSNEDDNAACPDISINGLLMSSHQVEVLFVLYSLLIGRRKPEVQSRLIKAGIFTALDRFCDGLDWTESPQETKTEESLKVHFIRLLHYMCDGLGGSISASRLELLFSEHERALLESIEEGKMPRLVGLGPTMSVSMSTSSPEPALLDLQSLSLNSCATANGATPSHSIQSEKESTGSHFYCSPIRSDNRCHLFGENGSSISPVSKSSGPLATGDDSSECTASSLNAVKEDCAAKRQCSSEYPRPGIICKIANILMKTPGGEEMESTRRYLLSGCVETFLRTANTSEKTLVAHRGLLVYLLKQLSESSNMTKQVSQFRQTSFDLLGQLVKWNRDLFSCMNEIFRQDPKLLPELLKAVSDRLIDSNVFVRSVVISLERFRAEDELQRSLGECGTSYEAYDFENCLLWEFVETYRIRLIHDLLSSVRVEDVNFENICCVNTTLILLVTSCPEEEALDLTLAKIAEMILESMNVGAPRPQSLFALNPLDIFENFGKLVDFWVSYYQYQGLDVASQEISSNIHFDRLVSVASLLQDRLPHLDEQIRREARAIQQE